MTTAIAAEAAAAQLSPDALRRTHEAGHAHVLRMVERGREAGEFRPDVPAAWQVSVFRALLHAAGDDVPAGRLQDDTAFEALTKTRLAALAPW